MDKIIDRLNVEQQVRAFLLSEMLEREKDTASAIHLAESASFFVLTGKSAQSSNDGEQVNSPPTIGYLRTGEENRNLPIEEPEQDESLALARGVGEFLDRCSAGCGDVEVESHPSNDMLIVSEAESSAPDASVDERAKFEPAQCVNKPQVPDGIIKDLTDDSDKPDQTEASPPSSCNSITSDFRADWGGPKATEPTPENDEGDDGGHAYALGEKIGLAGNKDIKAILVEHGDRKGSIWLQCFWSGHAKGLKQFDAAQKPEKTAHPSPVPAILSSDALPDNAMVLWRAMAELTASGQGVTTKDLVTKSGIPHGSIQAVLRRLHAAGAIDAPSVFAKILKPHPGMKATATKANPFAAPPRRDALQHVIDWLHEYTNLEVKADGRIYRINGRMRATPEDLINIANNHRVRLSLSLFTLDAVAAE